MRSKTLAAAVIVVGGALAVYYGHGLVAVENGLGEADLQHYLGGVIAKQAGVPIDQVGGIPLDQMRAFHTVLRPLRSPQFTGYEIVLSGFDSATCNQIMKSPWVENAAAAKALTTQCDDPKAEIHLLMAAR